MYIPHMSPILWTMVMFFTFLMLLLMMSMVYFSITSAKPTKAKILSSNLLLFWKW